ncbi:type II secretion system protein [Pseudothermotoga sp.]
MRRIRNMVRGFTLIELLIVLAVIAALLAIVTPIALNAVAQAKATQVASNFRNIKSAIETYVYTTQTAPSTIANLSSYISSWPSGFEVTDWPTEIATSATATFSIKYTGGVDTNRIRQILPEVSVSSDGTVTLTATIVKWW